MPFKQASSRPTLATHHQLARILGPLGHFHRRLHCRAAADAAQQALLLRRKRRTARWGQLIQNQWWGKTEQGPRQGGQEGYQGTACIAAAGSQVASVPPPRRAHKMLWLPKPALTVARRRAIAIAPSDDTCSVQEIDANWISR